MLLPSPSQLWQCCRGRRSVSPSAPAPSLSPPRLASLSPPPHTLAMKEEVRETPPREVSPPRAELAAVTSKACSKDAALPLSSAARGAREALKAVAEAKNGSVGDTSSGGASAASSSSSSLVPTQPVPALGREKGEGSADAMPLAPVKNEGSAALDADAADALPPLAVCGLL